MDLGRAGIASLCGPSGSLLQGSHEPPAEVPLGPEFATKCSEEPGPFITVNQVPVSGRKWSGVQTGAEGPCQQPSGAALLGFWAGLLSLCKNERPSFIFSCGSDPRGSECH